MEKQNTKLGMKPYPRKHREAFQSLVDTIFDILQGVDYPSFPKRPSWARILFSCRRWPLIPIPIEKEEIITEIFFIWKELTTQYYSKQRHPEDTEYDYILGYIPFNIRDWIIKQERDYIQPAEIGNNWWKEKINAGEETSPVETDISFLFKKKRGVYLSNWERQLAYLNHLCGKSLREMVPLLQKDRETLSNQMKRLDDKIRNACSPDQYKETC